MTDKPYINSPLVEVVCEFRLPPTAKWDLTTPGKIYEHVHNEFPTTEPRTISEVVLTDSDKGMNQRIQSSERVFFFSEDREKFIQVGNRILSIHHLKPYISWEITFEPIILSAFQALAENTDISTFQRIGLRYINRIEIPAPLFALDDYFDFKPLIDVDLKDKTKSIIVGAVFELYEGRDACRVQLTDTKPNDKNSSTFVLDIDYSTKQQQVLSRDQAMEWIKEAHIEVDKIFDKCTSQKLKDKFGKYT